MTGSASPEHEVCCPVVELRQYQLQPGQREALIDLFERNFIESQEALGIRVLGLFREPKRPDWFVWLRGFPDMPSRARSLQAFYGESAAWRDHQQAANATMIDSDNVLLLRPAGRSSGFQIAPPRQPPAGAGKTDPGVIVAAVYSSERPVSDQAVAWFENEGLALVRQAGVVPLAQFVTESAVNTFPRLPVRTGEQLFVWFGAAPDGTALAGVLQALAPGFAAAGLKQQQAFELEPTGRSLLRGTPDRPRSPE